MLEFNARFGDPETQVILMRMKSDLVPLLLTTAKSNLEDVEVEWHDCASICVVMASNGYPDNYEKGLPISGLEAPKGLDNVQVFHAGTSLKDGKVVTNGGVFWALQQWEKDLREAQKNVYEAIQKVSFNGAHYRRDIGAKAIYRKN